MDGLAIITGIGLTVFLLLYFAFQLEKKHFLLQVFTIGFSLFLLTLIPATTVDLDKDCFVNSTGGYYCYYSNGSAVVWNDFYENGSSTGQIFVRSYSYFLWVFALYLFIYFITSVIMWWQKRGGEK